MSEENVQNQSFYDGQILLHAAKPTEWIWTLSLNLSSLHETCTSSGQFISFVKYHVLVILIWNISLLKPGVRNLPVGFILHGVKSNDHKNFPADWPVEVMTKSAETWS